MELVLSGEVLGAMIIASGFAGFGFGAVFSQTFSSRNMSIASVFRAYDAAEDVNCAADLSPEWDAILHAATDKAELNRDGGFNRARHRRTVFADMPPVAQVHQQARQIAKEEPVWTAPELHDHLDQFMLKTENAQARLVSQYRRSIEALNDVETRAVGETLDDLLTIDSEHPYSRDISRLKLSA